MFKALIFLLNLVDCAIFINQCPFFLITLVTVTPLLFEHIAQRNTGKPLQSKLIRAEACSDFYLFGLAENILKDREQLIWGAES